MLKARAGSALVSSRSVTLPEKLTPSGEKMTLRWCCWSVPAHESASLVPSASSAGPAPEVSLRVCLLLKVTPSCDEITLSRPSVPVQARNSFPLKKVMAGPNLEVSLSVTLLCSPPVMSATLRRLSVPVHAMYC